MNNGIVKILKFGELFKNVQICKVESRHVGTAVLPLFEHLVDAQAFAGVPCFASFTLQSYKFPFTTFLKLEFH
jgi:hypothetical protein